MVSHRDYPFRGEEGVSTVVEIFGGVPAPCVSQSRSRVTTQPIPVTRGRNGTSPRLWDFILRRGPSGGSALNHDFLSSWHILSSVYFASVVPIG